MKKNWRVDGISLPDGAQVSNPDISLQEKYDNLCKEITRLQEKYDENGYDCSPTIKLQRMEQHIDSVIDKLKVYKKITQPFYANICINKRH